MGLRPRIPGYDLARYLAVFGFVVVDMVGAVVWGDHGAGFGERPEGPVVLYWSWQLWWGRASAMLAVLAGTGLALLFREGLGDDERARKRRVVLRRCVFLFATGHLWNSSTLWSFSILHYYTFFLAIGLLFVRARTRVLALAAAGFALVGVVDTLAFKELPDWMTGGGVEQELGEDELAALEGDAALTAPPVEGSAAPDAGGAHAGDEPTAPDDGDPGSGGEPDEDFEFEGDFGDPKLWEAEFWSLRHHLTGTLFDGMYPVFPWMAFLLFGMWLGRQKLQSRRFQLLMVAAGSLAAAAGLLPQHAAADPDIVLLLGTEAIPPGPFYVLSAGGSAAAAG